ncbi:MAG TPA: SEC-C metal-binding domain-containing protein [Casimicrobiaceae bacterium]
MKPGRNDPCPCGSGKKYKHCCLRAEQAPEAPESLAWRRLRGLLDEHNRDMLRFVSNAYGKPAFDEAWRRFVADEDAPFDPGDRDIPLFVPWFYHRWSPERGKSRVRDASLHGVIPTAEYLRRKRQLDPLLREYLESCLAAPFSALEILQADAGRGVLMKDLLTGEEHDVTERSASAMMQEGDLVFGQVARAGGVALLEASQAFVISPICKIEVIEFRLRHFEGAIAVAPERLRQAEDALFALYHEIAERLFRRDLPSLRNTDGDPLSLRRVVFDVPSAQEAFDALKHLAFDESDEELLREAAYDADGKLRSVRVPWLKRGNAQNPGWDNTVLGSIEIEGTRLSANVNSEKREQALREIVTKALGERARYRATEIQSLERLLAEGHVPAPAGEKDALAELPEVKAKVREMMAKHYEQWPSASIPALGGRTPLEAAKDPAGREAVEALVRQAERDGARMRPPLDPEIIRKLRERLQLT